MMARVVMEQVPALLTLHPDIGDRFFQQLVLAIRERTERQSQV
jgi:hypothetical protein